jgi:hypothetical protein
MRATVPNSGQAQAPEARVRRHVLIVGSPGLCRGLPALRSLPFALGQHEAPRWRRLLRLVQAARADRAHRWTDQRYSSRTIKPARRSSVRSSLASYIPRKAVSVRRSWARSPRRSLLATSGSDRARMGARYSSSTPAGSRCRGRCNGRRATGSPTSNQVAWEQWRFVRAAQESNQLGMAVLKPRRMRAALGRPLALAEQPRRRAERRIGPHRRTSGA